MAFKYPKVHGSLSALKALRIPSIRKAEGTPS